MLGFIATAHAQAEQIGEATKAGTKAVETIAAQGLIGSIAVLALIAAAVIIVTLCLIVRHLWVTIKERDTLIAVLQDKRTEDGKSQSKLLAEVATTGSATIAQNALATADLATKFQGIIDQSRTVAEISRQSASDLNRNYAAIEALRASVDAVRLVVGTGCRA